MSTKARLKLKCLDVEEHFSDQTNVEMQTVKVGETVSMGTVYDAADLPENNTFESVTPWATMQTNVTNPELFGFFQKGEAYYLDVTPVSKL